MNSKSAVRDFYLESFICTSQSNYNMKAIGKVFLKGCLYLDLNSA